MTDAVTVPRVRNGSHRLLPVRMVPHFGSLWQQRDNSRSHNSMIIACRYVNTWLVLQK